MNTTTAQRARARRGVGAVLLEFLGSMNLAISLLVAVAIASVIGTVLLQNQPYNTYYDRFGQFWFDIFRTLGLYNIYTTAWFLGILAFLVLSTSVCVYRNAPIMLRDMRSFRLNVRLKSLRAFHHREQWSLRMPVGEAERSARAYLESQRYRVRRQDHGDHVILAGMRGSLNRIGYLFTHLAVVVICIGGLIDGNVGLKLKQETGRLKVLTQDMPVSAIPASSRLAPGDTISFRGNRMIPEGSTVSAVILNLGDGYVLQKLPFSIEVTDFRIEYYASGQPKSFESDLVIHDKRLAKPLKRTISVNHPLIYRGYAIYQASFGDGGSKLTLNAWPLTGASDKPMRIKAAVFDDVKVHTTPAPLTLELTNFRLFNINPEESSGKGRKFRNWGPSFTFKLRNAAGEAYEYNNFMTPAERDGRLYYMSGVRKSEAQGFKYLRIPADRTGGLGRFMRFRALLNQPDKLRPIVEANARRTFAALGQRKPKLEQKLVTSLMLLLKQFASGGMDAILTRMQQQMTPQQFQKIGPTYISALRSIASAVYLKVLREEGVDVSGGKIDRADAQFFEDAFNALSVLPNYGAPLYFQMTGFKQIQATGLQITRSPGKNLVFLGSAMLIAGIFIMFYIAHRRAWVHLTEKDGGAEVLFAGACNRNMMEFTKEFEQMKGELGQVFGHNE